MSADPELPGNAKIMLDAINRALKTPVYAKSDNEHRAWRILLATSGALHAAGVSGFASAGTLREARRISRRNAAIKQQYNGRNLHDLAERYNLCSRQIRRIAANKSARKGPPKQDVLRDEIERMAEAQQEAILNELRLTAPD